MTSTATPALTIGMACYDDFDGVYFTATSLMVHHADVMGSCEIVVVDNHPESRHGRTVRRWMKKCVPMGRYIPFGGKKGTAQARNEVFRRARGRAVLCVDCHVLLAPGAVQRLVDYHQDHPDGRDLLMGPLISDAGKVAATHQDPKWRNGAWGVWGVDERGADADGEPFEIWQQGMGLFSCRRDAWVEFHPQFRGFGGCESYIMEKFRRRGNKVLCCPWLRWTHRFPRSNGVPYKVEADERIRNYVVGFQSLGMDIEPVLQHFNVASRQVKGLDRAKGAETSADDVAVVGSRKFVGVHMRGKVLARHLACKVLEPTHVSATARRRDTLIAIKRVYDAASLRASCDRLIYDPLDVFSNRIDPVDPVAYWRSAFLQLRFDDVLATSPACSDVMRAALPDDVGVHLVPHQCDPRVRGNWRDPDGPVVYAGLGQFVNSGLERIRQACAMIGKEFVASDSYKVLKGASLVLAFRLPPYVTGLYRRCKPQIKLENAAAAGLPVVATDCPASTSLRPEIETVPVDFSAHQLAESMQRALATPGLSNPCTNNTYLRLMDDVLQRPTMVVYTAIFGSYDQLCDPIQRTPGVRYLCFTDNPRLQSKVWHIQYCPPTGDPLFQAKRVKILAHEALDCEASLWVDGHVQLHDLNGVFRSLRADVAFPKHPLRDCIYEEARFCKRTGRGDPRRIDEAVARYQADGHPANGGLWRGGIVFRRHTAAAKEFNLQWWREVQSGTSRDQIILPVLRRRRIASFETLPSDVPRYQLSKHLK